MGFLASNCQEDRGLCRRLGGRALSIGFNFDSFYCCPLSSLLPICFVPRFPERISTAARDERAERRRGIREFLAAQETHKSRPRSRPVTPEPPPLQFAPNLGPLIMAAPQAPGALNLADIQVLVQAVQNQGAALQALAQNFVDQNAARVPREIETALPVFGGRAEEDVDEFIGAFTRIQQQHPAWNDARLKQTAVGRLVGLAQEWQDHVGHAVADWAAWSAALRAAFRRALGLLEWGQLMEGRTQGVGEPGPLYALAKMRIAQRCPHNLANAELVNHLIRGLHNREEAAALLGNPPADGPAFITRITELEAIRGPSAAAPVPVFPSLVYPGRPESRIRAPPLVPPPTFAPPLVPPPAVAPPIGAAPDPTTALAQVLARLPELIEGSVTRALRSNTGTRGYSSREPYGRRPSSGGAPTTRGPVVCYRCDREGHIARDCSERAGNGRAGGSAAGH